MTEMFRLPVAAAVLALAASVSAVSAHEFSIGRMHIEHPWARATPHGAKVAGGFFVVTNKYGNEDRLVSATAEIAETTEIHEMTMKDGVMTMRPVTDGLVVPAGGELELKPGGYHLMFVGLKRMLRMNESFAGTLTFEKAGTVPVRFWVESMAHGGAGHDGKGHDGKGHDGKGHDGKGHDGKGHDGKGHGGKGHN